ncbi:CinA family protein [Alloscardovia venturai]|uniref:CinA family protein n=1 Tax=Alloscardovia venturai TaxID=1769421 RepID=A0ABW2Y559_9BIFI
MSSTSEEQDDKAREVLDSCQRLGLQLCCAESLTGGLLADAFVRIPGASQTYLGSINSYAISAKKYILGVDESYLDEHGPVNAYTAEHMALGALQVFHCSGIALSTTGVAGPGPDGDIPAGTVFIAVALSPTNVFSRQLYLSGSREEVRRTTVREVLEFALHCVQL